MSYFVKEIFYTLQGEGARSGRPAVFCRFTGCNLWSGREVDRSKAICRFCDTDFLGTDGSGGGRFALARDLARAVTSRWPQDSLGPRVRPYVVCTGGEPLLQLDEALVAALHVEGFEVAVETNGTRAAPPGVDWLCVSPKAGSELLIRAGQELKLVFPQTGLDPESFSDLAFDYLYLQPLDGVEQEHNIKSATAYCKAHPQWRLGLQVHKLIGIR